VYFFLYDTHWLNDKQAVGDDKGFFTAIDTISKHDIVLSMKAKHAKILALIFSRPVSGNVRWNDALGLLTALGAEIAEAEGSRVRAFLFRAYP